MKYKGSFITAHLMFIVLVILVILPGEKQTKSIIPMLAAIIIMEVLYWLNVWRSKKIRAASGLMIVIWSILILWEVCVTQLDLMHPVLFPAPENVFAVFASRPGELIDGVVSSMELLFLGIIIGVTLGSLLGTICGWIDRIREVFYPIAKVLAPIPAIVFSPYIVAIMPTFRSASLVVIILGIFWPNFLNSILRVDSINQNIIESAKLLGLSDGEMIFQVLIPYSFPQIIHGLKITVTTGVTLLTFAEMMGATRGMGYFIVNYNTYGNYTNVVAGIIVVGIVVTLLNYLTAFLEKLLIRWKPD